MNLKTERIGMRCSPDWMDRMRAGALKTELPVTTFIQKAALIGAEKLEEAYATQVSNQMERG